MLYRWTNDDVLNEKEHERNKKIARKTGVANIFVGAYKDGEYVRAEYSKNDTGRNWFKDLFLGNEHDCEFYQSLEVSPPPPNLNKVSQDNKNISKTSTEKYIPPSLRNRK